MNKEYAIYPFRYMNITQRHDEGNHEPHSINVTNHSDKPWDEACEDGGMSYFEPQNDFLIEEILGIDAVTTNTVRLKSLNKLYIPYKNEPDYLYITLTHMNEDNLKEVYTGKILYKGSKILLEEIDGFATGNHFHVTANLGNYYGLLLNNNGKWCYTYDKSLLPSEAFYLDDNYTEVINNKEYNFLSVPKIELDYVGESVQKDENKNQIEIIATNLYVRTSPSINSKIAGYIIPGIYDYLEVQQSDGYSWYNIGIGWVAYSDKWANIYEIINKTNGDTEQEIVHKDNWFVKTFKLFINFVKKIWKRN